MSGLKSVSTRMVLREGTLERVDWTAMVGVLNSAVRVWISRNCVKHAI